MRQSAVPLPFSAFLSSRFVPARDGTADRYSPPILHIPLLFSCQTAPDSDQTAQCFGPQGKAAGRVWATRRGYAEGETMFAWPRPSRQTALTASRPSF